MNAARQVAELYEVLQTACLALAQAGKCELGTATAADVENMCLEEVYVTANVVDPTILKCWGPKWQDDSGHHANFYVNADAAQRKMDELVVIT